LCQPVCDELAVMNAQAALHADAILEDVAKKPGMTSIRQTHDAWKTFEFLKRGSLAGQTKCFLPSRHRAVLTYTLSINCP
jgi:hypothetical protein